MKHLTIHPIASAIVLIALASISLSAPAAEITYPNEDFAKLDIFEAVAVEDADKLFQAKDYRGAYAAYKAYSIEFARGEALPYVLLRMGRCLHLAGKRNTAIKAYQDVIDHFPNDVRYAAAAMYYIGQCHAQNGNEDKSLATWAKMVKDKAYVQEANSGTALLALSQAMQARGDYAEAAEYQWRTAVAFRKTNERAANDARTKVIYHFAVRSPNQERLLAFCNEVGGFGWRNRIDKPEESPAYWSHVLGVVLGTKLEQDKRIEVARYWDGQMGDRFADNDPLRVQWFNVRLMHSGDKSEWAKRMEAQFNLQPVDIGRVRSWLGYFNRFPEMRVAFYEKYGEPLVDGLDNPAKLSLAGNLRHPHSMHEQSLAVLLKVRTDGMDDEAIRNYAFRLAEYEGEDALRRTVDRMQDKVAAARARFDFFYSKSHRNGDMQQKALAEVPVLQKSPDHAQAITWPHAVLMQRQGQHEQAIKLFQAANRQPDSTWAIIDCRLALKQYNQAIQLCNELQAVGGGTAARACLKAADIYRMTQDKGKEVQQLQLVLRRYPGTGEASTAHQRLESYGVKLIGGEAEAED